MRTDRIVLIIMLLACAALGLVYLAIGLERSDQLASAIGGITGVAGLGVTLWLWLLERLRRPQSQPQPSTEGPPPPGTEGSRYNILIGRGQGVMIGDNGVQYNGPVPPHGEADLARHRRDNQGR